ncbi:MAG: cytochrome P450 [Mycobacteriaceae bacterium]
MTEVKESLTTTEKAVTRVRSALSSGRVLAKGTYRDLLMVPAVQAPPGVWRTTFDPSLSKNVANPFADYEILRQKRVAVNEELNVWMLTRYEDVSHAVKNTDIFSTEDGLPIRSTPFPMMLFKNGKEHDRLRGAVEHNFSKSELGFLTEKIVDCTKVGIERLLKGESVDIVREFTEILPSTIISSMLGQTLLSTSDFRKLSEMLMVGLKSTTMVQQLKFLLKERKNLALLEQMCELELKRRKLVPSDDLFGKIWRAVDSETLSRYESFAMVMILLIAGNDTTTNLLAMLLMKMAEDPELFHKMKQDRSLVSVAVEETARWGGPVQWSSRTTTEDVRIGEVVIPKYSRVMLFYGSANRDSTKFPNAEKFDIARKTQGHIGFSAGLHFCLGAQLARHEAITSINFILDQVDGLELTGPVEWRTIPSFRGPSSVPLRML